MSNRRRILSCPLNRLRKFQCPPEEREGVSITRPIWAPWAPAASLAVWDTLAGSLQPSDSGNSTMIAPEIGAIGC